jgi:glycosyltransferase involved in cell wall biosynthesis
VNLPPQKQPIRVLHPITRLIVGGAQENTVYTAALLNKQRFHVEVLSGPQTGTEGSLIEEVRQQDIPLTIFPDLLRQVSPWHDLKALWKMKRYIQTGGYTIVHTHSSKAGIIGRLAARLAKTPLIVHTVHGWSFHEYMSPVTRRIYIWLERWIAGFSDVLIVVTERDIEKGLQAGIGRREQYRRIHSAIPLDEFDPRLFDPQSVRRDLDLAEDAIVIGNVGRFSAQKNPLDWVRVAARVGQACPKARFLLVGDGPLRSQVEQALQQAGIAERTTLTGLRRDVPRMLAAMDIFLLTSLWEGLPRVIPQAMAMGLPVVANRADGVTEAIQDGSSGYLCSPGEIEQMAECCIELARSPLKRQEMGHRGQAQAIQEFDLHKMIASLEALYDELLAKT